MGEKLIMYYKYVGDLKGFMGKVELAKLTLMPTTIAAAAPDSLVTNVPNTDQSNQTGRI
jgi:hypothetical protein